MTLSDRVFLLAFGLSLGIHVVLLLGQLASWRWRAAPSKSGWLEVVYQDVATQREALQSLLEQQARTARGRGGFPSSLGVGERPQVRIPERSFAPSLQPGAMPASPTTAVDLANVIEAVRDHPVLFSYFGAIREQIQRNANRQAWLPDQPSHEGAQGVVYVSFVLSADGTVRGASIVPERSVRSPTLQAAARQIVESAGPFPPFPPSLKEPSKTILIPLEFLWDS
jgi:TonB family protein